MSQTLSSKNPISKVGNITINTSLISTHNCNVKSSRDVSYIVIHYTGNKYVDTAKANAGYFKTTDVQVSAHYAVDDSNIYQCIALKDTAWHCGTSGTYYSKCRNASSIGIEMCCTAGNYKVGSKTIANTEQLTAQLCKLIGVKSADVDTYVVRHYDVTHKECPAQMAGSNNSEWNAFKKKVKEILNGSETKMETNTSNSTGGLTAKALKGMTEAEKIAKVGPLCTQNQKETGVLAAVTMAQFILESGYATTDLALNANNCFGMKKSLSGNTWGNSTWDGKSIYTKKTHEQTSSGKDYVITADFRKYPCIEDSIADHSAYLLGAKNGSKLRYEGLKGCTDYKKTAQLIKDGGYATDTKYVSKLCEIITRWGLTKYNYTGNVNKTETTTGSNNKSKFPYLVRVNCDVLNVRKGPSTSYDIAMQIKRNYVYTIVDEKNGWGKLKSGAGWIKLSYTKLEG